MASEVIAYPDKMSFDSVGQSVLHSDAGNRIISKTQREAILRQDMFSVADDLQDHQGTCDFGEHHRGYLFEAGLEPPTVPFNKLCLMARDTSTVSIFICSVRLKASMLMLSIRLKERCEF